jgi:poly(3-hydroxyalkanoate) synthetase
MIDLSKLTAPICLLAGSDDEVVSVDQLFAVTRLVGTASEHLMKITEPCGHLSLFLGAEVLGRTWPTIARFLLCDLNETRRDPAWEHAPGMGSRSIRKSVG